MSRRWAVALVAVALAAGLSACGEDRLEDAETLRAIMRRTENVARGFVYTEQAGRTEFVVKGLIEDDFRYKATLSLNGSPVYDEVVRDDAIAARALQPAALSLLGRRPQQPGVAPPASTDASPGPAVADLLRARRWVLDPVGAPSLLPSATEKHLPGDDPVFDSLTIFRYVDLAMSDAFQVKRFNEDDLNYKAKEDPFEKPEKGSGVDRYDIERVFLPRPQQAVGASANQVVPAARHFRKMSVYVKGGLVIQVVENIDVVARLQEISERYDVDIPDRLSDDEKVKLVIDSINAVRRGQGEDPIRVRTMRMQFLRLDRPTSVALPGSTVEGSLAVLKNRGRIATSPTTAPAPSPTTTSAPAPAG
jgi:hypothetical protein